MKWILLVFLFITACSCSHTPTPEYVETCDELDRSLMNEEWDQFLFDSCIQDVAVKCSTDDKRCHVEHYFYCQIQHLDRKLDQTKAYKDEACYETWVEQN